MAETKSKVDFAIDRVYLVNGVFYRPGDEGKVPDEFREGLKAKIECQNLGRRMPAREVMTYTEPQQHPMDYGGTLPEDAAAEAAPARESRKKSEEG